MAEQPQDELIERFNQTLRDRVRSREEVIMVRKLMAARLSQSLGKEQVRHPLALIDPDAEILASPDPQGLQGEFIEAAKRYTSAHTRLAKAREENRELMAEMKGIESQKESKQQDTDQEIMDLHLEVTRLQKRYDQLRAVRRGLEDLEQLPAADPDFLNPEVMYSDCSPLPQMPKEMVDGFAVDHSATDARVEELLQALKKSVLRSKLVAQRAQRRHEEEQARDPLDPSSLPLDVKVRALKAVKDTLIDWIETQLSKTGDEGGLDATPRKPESQSSSGAEYDHDAQMAQIHGKYQRHMELRKQILTLLAQKDQIKAPPTQATDIKARSAAATIARDAAPARAPPASVYLLTPYIERLQALAREQKAMVREKSHINASLARQHEEARQVLDHLAQESHLLPKYPMTMPAAGAGSEPASFGEATQIAGNSDIAGQVQPWIYAADSAKIATLETVAEGVEEGMMSIDEARQALEQVCKLLNIDMNGVQKGAGGMEKDENEARPSSPKKVVEKKKDGPRNIWAILDGTLGSIQESNKA
jgi:hypothetical protein